MLVHGFVPTEFLLGSTLPIPKGHNANLTNPNNYRGITLSSIFGKLFDLVILHCYRDKTRIVRFTVCFQTK